MSHEATCPKGHRVQITEIHFGKQVRCPTCDEPFMAPDLGEKATPGPPLPGNPANGGGNAVAAGSAMGSDRLIRFSLLAGRPMLAVGLVLVMFSRGCDTIGNRAVKRAQAKQDLAKTKFENKQETARLKIQEKLNKIDDKAQQFRRKESRLNEEIAAETDADRRAGLRTELTNLQDARKAEAEADKEERERLTKELSELTDEQQTEQRDFDNGEYRDYRIAAEEATANNSINGYWRQIFFVFSSLVLAVGLLTVSWTSRGAERWICLVMLAILTFSIYIAGTAWVPGLQM